MACPTFETVIDFVDGRLSPAGRDAIERHLAGGCESCAGAIGWYRSFTQTARSDVSPDPPQWVTQSAINMFREAREAAEQRGLRGLIARVRAALVFDSFAEGPRALDAAPARSSGPLDARQLLYSTPAFDVDLFVAPAGRPEQLMITGQVLSTGDVGFEDVGGVMVELERGGEIAAVAETSGFGEFSFQDVAPGTYDLRLVRGSREIVIARAPIMLQ